MYASWNSLNKAAHGWPQGALELSEAETWVLQRVRSQQQRWSVAGHRFVKAAWKRSAAMKSYGGGEDKECCGLTPIPGYAAA